MDDTSFRGLQQFSRDRETSFMLCLLAFGLRFPMTLLWQMLRVCFVGGRRLVTLGNRLSLKMLKNIQMRYKTKQTCRYEKEKRHGFCRVWVLRERRRNDAFVGRRTTTTTARVKAFCRRQGSPLQQRCSPCCCWHFFFLCM